MDRVFQTGVPPATRRGSAYLGRLLRRFHRLATEQWRRRTAIRELRRLDRHALRDAGIEPYEIEDVIDDMLARNRRDE
jgi:uncharacterized protein YjiS (DUF1127 family)